MYPMIIQRLPVWDKAARFCRMPHVRNPHRVLQTARASEPRHVRRLGVAVAVEGEPFAGESYNLALVLGDRLLRHGREGSVPIIATGILPPDGKGGLAPVKDFLPKAEGVLRFLDGHEGSITFAYPQANAEQLSADLRLRLEAAQVDGRLRLRPARHLRDLKDLWTTPAMRRARHVKIAGLILGGAGLVAVSAVALERAPSWRCEASLAQLDVLAKSGTRADLLAAPGGVEGIAKAVRACALPAADRPRDGHLNFLAGQAMDLSAPGSGEGFWQVSAELGDVDGMAAYGAALWARSRRDPRQLPVALDWLSRAKAKGSAYASEVLGQNRAPPALARGPAQPITGSHQ